MSGKDDDYATVRIPRELASEVDNLIGKMGFRTKAEVVKEAIRNLLNHYEELEKKSRFEKINADENGVKILDRQGEIHHVADVYFQRTGIHCNLDDSDDCEHITFALAQKDVQKLIRQKRAQGWKLPDV